ncbi:MAG TPA: copper transporter [Natronosporangium sp.]
MINFRYHVVSLTAVFLALAVGLVLGSTVLNGPMLDALESRVDTLGRDNSQLRDHVSSLEADLEREEDFATEAGPLLLDGQLSTRRITMLVMPGGEEYAPAIADVLELGGATITGTVTLTDKFTHPQHRRGELLQVATDALPPSVDGDALPANSDGVETSAALLAAVLLDRGSASLSQQAPAAPAGDDEDDAQLEPTVPDADRRAVLSSYAALEYLEQEGVTGPAELILVVAGLPDAESDADERNQAVFTAVSQFARVGPLVVAASGGSGDGNVVAEVRSDPTLSTEVSTVDNASTPQGQIATGLTVAQQLAGSVGHYGVGGGADGLLPDALGQ